MVFFCRAEALRDTAGERLAAVQYDNGSSETFLRWLWHELYGDEPFDADSFSGLQGPE